MIQSIAQLLCLTRHELLERRRTLELQLGELPHNSEEFRDSLANLANVRLVLARPELRPRPPSPWAIFNRQCRGAARPKQEV